MLIISSVESVSDIPPRFRKRNQCILLILGFSFGVRAVGVSVSPVAFLLFHAL